MRKILIFLNIFLFVGFVVVAGYFVIFHNVFLLPQLSTHETSGTDVTDSALPPIGDSEIKIISPLPGIQIKNVGVIHLKVQTGKNVTVLSSMESSSGDRIKVPVQGVGVHEFDFTIDKNFEGITSVPITGSNSDDTATFSSTVSLIVYKDQPLKDKVENFRTPIDSIGVERDLSQRSKISASIFAGTQGIAINTNEHRLYVTDEGNKRVLIFKLNDDNTLQDKIADYVLGQKNFTTGGDIGDTSLAINSGRPVENERSMISPVELAVDEAHHRLFVSDSNNNRVLIFDTSKITNNMKASNVLGQLNFTTSAWGSDLSNMSYPKGLAYDAVRNYLYVVDQNNSRVLIFDVADIKNGQPAMATLGDEKLTESTFDGAFPNSFRAPMGVFYDSTMKYLFVADRDNARVLIFDMTNISSGMSAKYVLGHTDFTTKVGGQTDSLLYSPQGVFYDNNSKHLFVSDGQRVAVYDLTTIQNGQKMIDVIGQETYLGVNYSPIYVEGKTLKLRGPRGIWFDSQNDLLYVADLERILLYKI